MSAGLTAKQQLILDFLKNEIRRKGYPPTVREICDSVGLSSTSTVHSHLETLERKGYIRRSPTKNRSIEVLEQNFYGFQREYIDVPILGQVTAGDPILAVENIEDTFPIPTNYVSDGTYFMLRVKGDSMIGAGIYNKDLVLVRQQPSADNGDVVVALLGDSATVKTFYKEDGFIRLQPENSAFQPILVKDLMILGKVMGLFRKF